MTDVRTTVAKLFLAAAGGPDTPAMEAAVIAWLMKENGPGRTITRNNPWNLHSSGGLPGQIGSVYVGPGDLNVAVFDTLEHGVAAAVHNLVIHGRDFARYDRVLAMVRAGNALGFLDALSRSAWSAGRYGGPADNALVPIYRALIPPPPVPAPKEAPVTTVQEQLRLIGLSLSHAAAQGDLAAVAKWAARATALVAPHADPIAP